MWANPLQQVIRTLLERWKISGEYNHLLTFIVLMAFLLLLNVVAGGLLRGVLNRLFIQIEDRSDVPVNRKLITRGVIGNFAFFVPLVISLKIVPEWFSGYNAAWLSRLVELLLVLSFAGLLKSIFRSVKEYLAATPGFRDKPLDSYLQVMIILVHIISGLVIFTLFTGVSTWKFLGSLGAASAVLMLVFKDTILGFVASIQVSVNDMVRVGDWIEMPRFQADGDVQEISLNTVKVRNWDKTISTIPTYMLVTESVKNWRGMKESGGRRIKRSVNLSSESVRHLKEGELAILREMELMTPVLARYSLFSTGIQAVNERTPTNLGLFREYAFQYVRNHPEIRQDMTLLVRHLAPSEKGIPLEVYVFTNTTVWTEYERIMAEIFEHLFAVIPYFGLKMLELYPYPGSADGA